MKMMPASLHFWANSAFSDRKPYLQGTQREEESADDLLWQERGRRASLPGMDHVNSMLEGDSDDVVLSEVSRYRSQALSDLVSFIGLVRK
jgi:hypothetical protein